MKIAIPAILAVIALVAIAVAIAKNMKGSDQIQDEWPPEVVAKVERDRHVREAVKRQYPALFVLVTQAMFRHDPIGINFETNTDEYDAEAGTVIPRLKDCSSSEDVTTVLHEEFSTWFGSDSVGPRDHYTKLGEELWLLWKAKETEQDGGGQPATRHESK